MSRSSLQMQQHFIKAFYWLICSDSEISPKVRICVSHFSYKEPVLQSNSLSPAKISLINNVSISLPSLASFFFLLSPFNLPFLFPAGAKRKEGRKGERSGQAHNSIIHQSTWRWGHHAKEWGEQDVWGRKGIHWDEEGHWWRLLVSVLVGD